MDISIVIPTHKRAGLLKRCLESVFAQEYPGSSYEVIVVMDGADIDTEAMLKETAVLRDNLRYAVQEEKGPAAARNLGARLASGGIIGFTDDDCLLSPGWIKSAVMAHRDNPQAAIIGGKTVTRDKAGSQVSQFLANGAIRCNIAGRQEFIFFPTCNVSCRRQLLEKERFNELFALPAGEDLEYFWKLFKLGHRYAYCEGMEVFHDRQSGLFSFIRQAYSYGRGNYLVEYIHRDHPLLHEINTENHRAFFAATAVNLLKIPRFSWVLGKRLLSSLKRPGVCRSIQVYSYLALHKAVYLWGNITEHFKAFRDYQRSFSDSVPRRPDLIIIDVTHRCNLSCNICDIRKDHGAPEMNTSLVKDLIAQAKEWGVKDLALSGGEPLVREDIFQVLDFVGELGYHIGVITNGFILTEDFLERLLPYISSGALSLVISLDALTPGVHDDIRGTPGSFKRTLSAIEKLSTMKKKGAKAGFSTISIILDENLHELFRLAEFLKSKGADTIQFQPLLANNLIMKERSQGVRYWVRKERLPALDEAIDLLLDFKKMNPRLLVNSRENLMLVKRYFRGDLSCEDVKCRSVTRTMLIANNGKVTTCFNDYGDINSQRLKDIWRSRKADEARIAVSMCKKPCLLPCFTD